MSIQIPPELAAAIERKVASGQYHDASAVIREAMRSLEARERQAQRLRASIEAGLAAVEQGEGVELTPDLWAEIDQEADEHLRLGLPPKADVCP